MNTQKLKRQKNIRYKVIKQRSRYSCSINGNSPFAIKYVKGKEIYALPYTLGIMTFETLSNAQAWLASSYYYIETLKIIKVIPIGRGRRVQEIVSPSRLKEFYGNDPSLIDEFNKYSAPHGTICYPGVYVMS